jgi:hypothetical protein
MSTTIERILDSLPRLGDRMFSGTPQQPAAYLPPIACDAAPLTTCPEHLGRPIQTQRLLSLLPLWNFHADFTSSFCSCRASYGRREQAKARPNDRGEIKGLESTDATRWLPPPSESLEYSHSLTVLFPES